ncbi:MAG TPA: nucleotidyltransferase domain-containing protein [Thermomicrobiales bacterium]|nr:nucleotidyltransferase domain-containing protein [Thermomicrobiales bacterium]
MKEIAPNPPVKEILPGISPQVIDALREFDVTEAWIFGSVALGTARPDSDLDLLVTFGQPTTLFRQIDLAEHLRAIVGRDVHLMTRIAPVFEPYIRPTLIPLPL